MGTLLCCRMRTGRPKKALALTEDERHTLEQWARRPKTAQRLALRARIMLAKRLERHGLAFSGGLLAVALSQNAASAAVPGALAASTVVRITAARSSASNEGNSPVVPAAQIP